MARVLLEGVSKTFPDGTVALHELHLEIRDREFLTLLGPSGCGKTTTLRMIAGLESPTTGSIYFDDREIVDLPPFRRNVAMVFQSYALYPHLSVRGNLEYPLKKRGVGKEERARRVAELGRLLQIAGLLDRKPRQLSGGQQQRVALGRAIIRQPEVFLLDEPLSNLDAKLRAYMRAELIQLHQRIATTVVYVTHDQLEAMTMSHRIAIMNEGRLQQIGTPDEVYNEPANQFVAGFVGVPAMNFVAGSLRADGDALTFEGAGLAIRLGDAAGRTVRRGGARAVVVGVRPEDVMIGRGTLRGEIAVVEPTGHETLVLLRLDGISLTARTAPDFRARVGETAAIELRETKIHVFDHDTGARLA